MILGNKEEDKRFWTEWYNTIWISLFCGLTSAANRTSLFTNNVMLFTHTLISVFLAPGDDSVCTKAPTPSHTTQAPDNKTPVDPTNCAAHDVVPAWNWNTSLSDRLEAAATLRCTARTRVAASASVNISAISTLLLNKSSIRWTSSWPVPESVV